MGAVLGEWRVSHQSVQLAHMPPFSLCERLQIFFFFGGGSGGGENQRGDDVLISWRRVSTAV